MSAGLYKAILHTHEGLVGIYVLLFTIKLVLLLAGKKEALANFRKKTKVIGEMVLPSLFIIAGVILLVGSPAFLTETWMIIKFIMVILATVLGIITFKRNSAVLGIITFLIFGYLMMLSYRKDVTLKKGSAPKDTTISANPDPATKAGYDLYTKFKCADCHGANGDLRKMNASDLSKTILPEDGIKAVIKNGRNNMAPYGSQMNDDEIAAITKYVMSLQKK
jgi:uncharacterized membrane protein SirB2